MVQNIAPESSLKENIMFLTSSSGVVRTNKPPGIVFSNLSSIKKRDISIRSLGMKSL